MKGSFLKIQTTSNWPQIWYGGWNCVLIEAYQISPKSETKNFLRFGLVCFGHKSWVERPPFFFCIKYLGSLWQYDITHCINCPMSIVYSFIIFISRSSMSQSIIKAKSKCSNSNHTSIHVPTESIKSESCERAKCESCGSWFHRETRLRTCFCCVWVRQVWWVLFYETMKHKMS